jgi:hypothetical protein
VGECSAEAPFFLASERICLESCPESSPFYSDTRLQGSGGSAEATCLSNCDQLGDADQVYLSAVAPFRCTTSLQATRDGQNDDDFPLAVVLAITMSTIALILLIIMLIVLARRRKSAKMVVTPMALQDRREPMFSNPIYVPGASTTKV